MRDGLPRYRQDSVAAIARTEKVIVRRDGMEHYVLNEDPCETRPTGADLDDFAIQLPRDGVPASIRVPAVAHLRRWSGPARVAA